MRVFSNRSKRNLEGVHPDLVKCCEIALQLSESDFTVIEGLRSIETQKEYVARGVSKTMKSRHLLQHDGYGHAVDLYPYYNGSVQVKGATKAEQQEIEKHWRMIAVAMKKAADELGIAITWGGDWKSFVDMPHFQLEAK